LRASYVSALQIADIVCCYNRGSRTSSAPTWRCVGADDVRDTRTPRPLPSCGAMTYAETRHDAAADAVRRPAATLRAGCGA